jgi:hypothetical protein
MEFLPCVTPPKTFLSLCLIFLSLRQKTKTTRTVTKHTKSSKYRHTMSHASFLLMPWWCNSFPGEGVHYLPCAIASVVSRRVLDWQQSYLPRNFPFLPLSSCNCIFQEISLPCLYQVSQGLALTPHNEDHINCPPSFAT